MSAPIPELILASQSPRRRQILEALGVKFRVEASSAEERTGSSRDVEVIVKGNALAKAREVAGRIRSDGLFLGADTVVVRDEVILGKPVSKDDARCTLQSLSGRAHTVVTGLALVGRSGERTSAVRTEIRFRKLTDAEIDSYLLTPEPYDKAGSYGIQGLASLFVAGMDGSYTNVMGLPIEQMLRDLEALTQVPVWRWVSP